MLLIQPLAGRLSDRVGRKPVMIFFGVGGDAVHLSDLHRAGAHARASLPAFALVMAAW